MMNLNLNRREKLAVYGAGGFIAVFILVQLIVVPVFDKQELLRDQLAAKGRALSEMRQLQREYQGMQNQMAASMNQFKKRPDNFALFSFLDQLAGKTGIKKHVSYMKPSTTVNEETGMNLTRVEMKLQDISLRSLVRYLYHVETSENMVIINRLSISRKGGEESLLDVVLQVETVET